MSIMTCPHCSMQVNTDYDTDHIDTCVHKKEFSFTDLSTYPLEVLEKLYPEQI